MGKTELRIEIDEGLLAQAEAAGVDVAPLVESILRSALPGQPGQTAGISASNLIQKVDPAGAEERGRRWAEDNAAAIKAYEERIEREGCFGEEWRNW